MRILLTNDDSYVMPFLGYALEYLESLGELKVLVPAQEQSWKAKSLTGTGRLKSARVIYAGREISTLAGTPADCANIGIYHFFDQKPDLLVSGVNVGPNAGLSFLLSSGTVGACLDANIAGVPAVALSQDLPEHIFPIYRKTRTLPAEMLLRIEQQCRVLLPAVFEVLLKQAEFFSRAITWTVNFPFLISEHTEIKLCQLARNYYLSLYAREGEEFVKGDFSMIKDKRPDTDWNQLGAGHVVVTPIDIQSIGQVAYQSLGKVLD